MTSKFKIALIYPYYGSFPWYFKFFLHTCKFNPSIDFLIFTDIKIYNEIPNNVIINKISFAELKKDFEKKLGFSISLERPFKLCDFRPAFGELFSDYLNDYDFWGHGDIDVILGNIRNFITDTILYKSDVICVREEYVTGFFTLYRNNDEINNIYKESKDYKKIFTQNFNFTFDECGKLFGELKAGKDIFSLESDIETMTHVVKRLDYNNKIKAHFDLFVIESTPGQLRWENGTLSYKDKFEVMLYHLISFKLYPKYLPFYWKQIPSNFYVHKNFFSAFPITTLLGRLNYILISACLKSLSFKQSLMMRMTELKLFFLQVIYRNKYKMKEVEIKMENNEDIRVKRIVKL